MYENRDRNYGTVCCVKLRNNCKIRQPLSARNKQTKRNEQNEITKQQAFHKLLQLRNELWSKMGDTREGMGEGGKGTSGLGNFYLSKQYANMPDNIKRY